MDSKRVLFISQEIHPYLPENKISSTTLALAKKTNNSGHQVRVFMPRFGVINERRHQLHEVIRLSGMNVVPYSALMGTENVLSPPCVTYYQPIYSLS